MTKAERAKGDKDGWIIAILVAILVLVLGIGGDRLYEAMRANEKKGACVSDMASPAPIQSIAKEEPMKPEKKDQTAGKKRKKDVSVGLQKIEKKETTETPMPPPVGQEKVGQEKKETSTSPKELDVAADLERERQRATAKAEENKKQMQLTQKSAVKKACVQTPHASSADSGAHGGMLLGIPPFPFLPIGGAHAAPASPCLGLK